MLLLVKHQKKLLLKMKEKWNIKIQIKVLLRVKFLKMMNLQNYKKKMNLLSLKKILLYLNILIKKNQYKNKMIWRENV